MLILGSCYDEAADASAAALASSPPEISSIEKRTDLAQTDKPLVVKLVISDFELFVHALKLST